MGATQIKIKKKEYTIFKELGKKGFGRVVQVLDQSDNKPYAIKVIPIKGETEEKIKNIQNEVDILSKINCNNIVKYYDTSKDGNDIYTLNHQILNSPPILKKFLKDTIFLNKINKD